MNKGKSVEDLEKELNHLLDAIDDIKTELNKVMDVYDGCGIIRHIQIIKEYIEHREEELKRFRIGFDLKERFPKNFTTVIIQDIEPDDDGNPLYWVVQFSDGIFLADDGWFGPDEIVRWWPFQVIDVG